VQATAYTNMVSELNLALRSKSVGSDAIPSPEPFWHKKSTRQYQSDEDHDGCDNREIIRAGYKQQNPTIRKLDDISRFRSWRARRCPQEIIAEETNCHEIGRRKPNKDR
jgi:hypothetical protein